MTWAAIGVGAGSTLLSAGGNYLSSLTGANASRDASHAMARAAEEARRQQADQYWQNIAMMAPWRRAGKKALNQLTGMLKAGPGEYEKSPYYDFLMEQGTEGLERGAAARGSQFSGSQAKALTKYGQNLASTDYDNWLKRWYQSLTPYQSLAGVGQTTSGQMAQMGSESANQISNYMMQGGQAQAAGQLGQANAWAPFYQWGGNQAANLLTQFGQQKPQGGQFASNYMNW